MLKLKARNPKALVLLASKARLIQRSALFCALSKSSKRDFWRFFIFFKKINQNWNKTLGSWHYWYKPLIWHVFSVTYLSKKDILSVTCPKRLKPNPQPPSSSLFLFLFFLDFSPWNSNTPNFFLFYFFPFGYLLGTNYHVAMSSYSLAHSWEKKKYDITYLW